MSGDYRRPVASEKNGTLNGQKSNNGIYHVGFHVIPTVSITLPLIVIVVIGGSHLEESRCS